MPRDEPASDSLGEVRAAPAMKRNGGESAIDLLRRDAGEPTAVSAVAFGRPDQIAAQALNLAEPVCVSAPDGEVLFANAAYEALAAALRPAAGTPVTTLALEELRRTGHLVRREDRLRVNGRDRSLRSRHVPLRGEDGELVAVASFYADVTDELGAREQIGNLQSRLYDLTRLVSDWVWETDVDLAFVFASRRTTEIMGMMPYELNGKTLPEFGRFLSETGEPIDTPPAIERQVPFRDLLYAVDVGGEDRLFLLSGLPVFDDETGEFTGYRGTARDVTAETEAVHRAAASQSALEDAIENIGEGFALFDAEARLILCNSKFAGYYPHVAHRCRPGVPISELTRMAVEAGDVIADDPEDFIAMRLGKWGTRDSSFEFQLGDGRWLQATDRVTADGKTVAIRTDITELKKREHALLKAKHDAELADKAKSQFLANISHELRTPLNAIIGFAELLESTADGAAAEPRWPEFIGEILTSGRHLLGVINDILVVAQAESGQLQLHAEIVDPAPIIDAALRQMQEAATHARVTLVGPTEELPALHVDGRKLRQILVSLLDNAIRFNRPGGRVVVLADTASDGGFAISIADTGIGIAEANVETALRPFGQVDGGLDREFAGTGVGLPLARALCELHGGRLELSSSVGVGTTVTAHFPSHRVRVAPTD